MNNEQQNNQKITIKFHKNTRNQQTENHRGFCNIIAKTKWKKNEVESSVRGPARACERSGATGWMKGELGEWNEATRRMKWSWNYTGYNFVYVAKFIEII